MYAQRIELVNSKISQEKVPIEKMLFIVFFST